MRRVLAETQNSCKGSFEENSAKLEPALQVAGRLLEFLSKSDRNSNTGAPAVRLNATTGYSDAVQTDFGHGPHYEHQRSDQSGCGQT